MNSKECPTIAPPSGLAVDSPRPSASTSATFVHLPLKVLAVLPIVFFAVTSLGCLESKVGGQDPTVGDECDAVPSREVVWSKLAACVDGTGYTSLTWALYSSTATGPVKDAARCELSCIGRATTCDEVRACSAHGALCEPSFQDSCDGQTLVRCERVGGTRRVKRTDCAADHHGATECVADADGARCLGPPCEGDAELTCEGDRLTGCWNGRRSDIDCRITGGTCGTAATGATGATCVNTAGESLVNCTRHCDGDLFVTCQDGGPHYGVSYDCAKRYEGGFCFDAGDSLGCGSSGADAGCKSRCEGDVAVQCVKGVEVPLDCGIIPAGTCVEQGGYPICEHPDGNVQETGG